MQKVKIRTQTNYNGKTLRPGDVVGVPDDVAARWSKRNIARLVVEKVTPEKINDERAKSPARNTGNQTANEKGQYDGMKPKDLYDLCVEKGLKVEAKKDAAYYIEKLTAAEAGSKQ